MSLTRPDPASAAMLAGLVASLAAVWVWGDVGASMDDAALVATEVATPPSTPPLPAAAVAAVETVIGPASATETAAVLIGGRRLQLHGVLPVGHPQAVMVLNDFLASAGPLQCREAGPDAWSCVVAANGVDVAEVALLSGLAFTGPEASRKYVNAQKDAQRRKTGIWGGDDQ